MLVGLGLRLFLGLANDDNGVDAILHLAAEFPDAALHLADFVLNALQALFVIGAVPVVIDEPAFAFLCDDIHAVVRAAGGIERRVGRAHRARRHFYAVEMIEVAVECDGFLGPQAFHHLDEFLHLPVAATVRLDPLAIHIMFLRTRSVDNVDAEAAAADAIERGTELGHDARIGDAGMHGGHDLHLADHGCQRRRIDPGIEVGSEPALRDERDVKAKLFGAVEHFHRIVERAVRSAAMRRQCIMQRLGERIGANGLRGWCPDAEAHGHVLLSSWVRHT